VEILRVVVRLRVSLSGWTAAIELITTWPARADLESWAVVFVGDGKGPTR
jgi:hypothetical protein